MLVGQSIPTRTRTEDAQVKGLPLYTTELPEYGGSAGNRTRVLQGSIVGFPCSRSLTDPWYSVTDSNRHHQVRSLASCPLNERSKWGDQRESNPLHRRHNPIGYRYTMVTVSHRGIEPRRSGLQPDALPSELAGHITSPGATLYLSLLPPGTRPVTTPACKPTPL